MFIDVYVVNIKAVLARVEHRTDLSLGIMVSTERKVLLSSFCLRLVSAFMQQTWFVPDEHWQSMEVAHKFIFGYGHLTWEWTIGIRSYLYPLVICAIFKILQILQMDSVYFITLLPRIFHALLAVINDVYIYWLAREEFGKVAGEWTAFLNLSSWFMFYTMSRTIINSVETVLTTISAYYFFKWCHKQNYRLIIVTFTIIIDRICFGTWVIVPYNFLKFNLVHGIGTFYGNHPWHWYLFQGLPTVLGTQFIPVLLGALKIKKHLVTLVIIWTIFVYSLLGHKEFRFILPIVPLAMCLAGYYCSKYLRRYSNYIIAAIIFTNTFPAVYFSMLHQRGPIDVVHYLANEANENEDMSVLYLMPCHSTPYYSHIHRNISMRFLSCEPQLENQYVTDEAEVFYRNPEKWLKSYLIDNYPSHIVMYDVLLKNTKDILKQHKYSKCYDLFHAHIADGRIGLEILVFYFTLCNENDCSSLSFSITLHTGV
ncbi:GPI mannosyltransferase 3 [Nymphon striatum]|nr:GPI mannosyltransferase 3 [Nymphon striatum]